MRKKRKPSRYVVWGPNGMYHLARWDTPISPLILWLGNGATIFNSKKSAQKAIDKTKLFRDKQTSYKWPWVDISYPVKLREPK